MKIIWPNNTTEKRITNSFVNNTIVLFCFLYVVFLFVVFICSLWASKRIKWKFFCFLRPFLSSNLLGFVWTKYCAILFHFVGEWNAFLFILYRFQFLFIFCARMSIAFLFSISFFLFLSDFVVLLTHELILENVIFVTFEFHSRLFLPFGYLLQWNRRCWIWIPNNSNEIKMIHKYRQMKSFWFSS